MANTANHRESLSYDLVREDRPRVLVVVSLLHLLPAAMAEEAVPLEAVEVDPKKLISKNGVIGYEKAEGFQAMTNFDVRGHHWLCSAVVRGSYRLLGRSPSRYT